MRPRDTAKFALQTLVICANAHCGEGSLTAKRLANILTGQARRITRAEKRLIREILDQADPDLLERAMKEAGADNKNVGELICQLA